LRILTLLSDFGSGSSYPAAMKAVVAARVDALMIDISHDLPRHDVRAGAFLLAAVAPVCPAGTVHLAVVDPGVGTARRPLVVASGGQYFVGPDNGLLLAAARRVGTLQAYHLDPRIGLPAVSATFQGRDLFAPAAARLLLGEPPGRLGRPIADPVALDLPRGGRRGALLHGEVLYIDPFGNVVTSIPAEAAPHGAQFRLTGPGRTPRIPLLHLRATYAEGAFDELLLVPGSEGLLEIAVREGNAAARTGLDRGAPVRLQIVPAAPRRRSAAPSPPRSGRGRTRGRMP